jgi:heavy metal sensor kinase
MIKSLRWRLQLWHAAILVLVVAGLGTTVLVQFRQMIFSEVDAELLSGARVLESALMQLGGGPPDGPPPRGRDGPGQGPGPGNRPRPFRPPIENLDMLPDDDFRLPGSMLFRRGGPRDDPPWFAIFSDAGAILRASPDHTTVATPLRPWRSHDYRMTGNDREVVLRGPGETLIVTGRNVTQQLHDFNRLLTVTVVGAATVLAIGLIGGWWLSGRAIAPIEKISRTAESVTATSLSRRVDASQMDIELADLAGILNSMLQRLQDSFEQQTRFTADASHELRTPISVLIMHSELALGRERSAEDYQATLKTCLKASQRMKQLVEDLLLLARADAGELGLRREETDLALLVDEAAEWLMPLAEENGISVRLDTQSAVCQADSGRLLQAIGNLLKNAIVHNRPGGEVVVRTGVEGDAAIFEASDTGEGIEARHLSHLFERFYRIDEARSRDAGGSGLGLAICHTIVTAHGGTIEVDSQRGKGSRFVIRLPKA